MINLYKDVYVTFRKITKKPVPKDIEKPVAIKLGEQVEVKIEIEDQSSSSNFDVSFFKERIKRRGLVHLKYNSRS